MTKLTAAKSQHVMYGYCKFIIIIINILTYSDTLDTLETGRVQNMEGSNKKDRACHLVPIFIMITH